MPIYLLAPHSTAAETVPALAQVASAAIAEAGADNVVLIGDSAGGGMVLAAAEHLRDHTQVQPARIILILPWLDVTMIDP